MMHITNEESSLNFDFNCIKKHYFLFVSVPEGPKHNF